jgi:hypothetical protein
MSTSPSGNSFRGAGQKMSRRIFREQKDMALPEV